MFSKGTKVKFFHSDYLSAIENEINSFIETLPEEYQILYMRYYPPKYAGAQYVVYIMYEPMVVVQLYDVTANDCIKSAMPNYLWDEEIE